MNTAGQYIADTPFNDAQFFIGVSKWRAVGGGLNVATDGQGSTYYALAASTSYNMFSDLAQLLRTGYAPDLQEQFGTTGPPPVAGPSAVANTSGPLGLDGYPPIKTASLPTIAGPVTGYKAKGTKINWIDIIYSVAGAALTSAQMALTNTVFANNVAPAVTNIIALGANGLQTAIQANPYRTRVIPAAPAFVTTDGSEVILNTQIVLPAGSTAKFYGAVLGCSFNFC